MNRPKPDEEMRYLTPEQWRTLRVVIDDDAWRCFFDLLQSCGLRTTEGLSLTPAHLRIAEGVVMVPTLKREGRPTLPVDVRPDLLDALRARIERLGLRPSDHIFPWGYHLAWERFKRYAKLAGLNERLSPHSLRHLFGLKMAEVTNGDLVAVAKSLRHAGQKHAWRYVHLRPSRRRALAEQVWALERGETPS